MVYKENQIELKVDIRYVLITKPTDFGFKR